MNDYTTPLQITERAERWLAFLHSPDGIEAFGDTVAKLYYLNLKLSMGALGHQEDSDGRITALLERLDNRAKLQGAME